ncbi:MAG TPA: glycerol-3-phosphate 1-O-acyltransferase PlsY [Terriglobales bacterium]|nr:glycerol-3-phosphate 1-O-acyltransferase PlsY [Terriglobales bacterium]
MLPRPPLFLLPVVAFLLGSIPFGYLVYRLRTGGDIRQIGSGNIGATNVLRASGKTLGILTLLLDAAKGWLAVWLALRWAPGASGLLAAVLLLAILGHLYSPWLRFRGGKGVATALGAFLALAPWPLLGALAVFALVLALWRYVSLASIAACLALPLLLFVPGPPALAPGVKLAAVATAALIILRHRPNLARLRAGTEHKLGART